MTFSFHNNDNWQLTVLPPLNLNSYSFTGSQELYVQWDISHSTTENRDMLIALYFYRTVHPYSTTWLQLFSTTKHSLYQWTAGVYKHVYIAWVQYHTQHFLWLWYTIPYEMITSSHALSVPFILGCDVCGDVNHEADKCPDIQPDDEFSESLIAPLSL